MNCLLVFLVSNGNYFVDAGIERMSNTKAFLIFILRDSG